MASVSVGLWHDHDSSFWNAHQVTLPVWSATIVGLLLGILLGGATPQLKKILYRTWDRVALRWRRTRDRKQATSVTTGEDEESTLLTSGEQTASYEATQPAPGHGQRSSSASVHETPTQAKKNRSKISESLVFLAVVVGWAFASGLIASIPQSELGTSNSVNCAVYNLKANYSGPERRTDDLIQASKEVRAGEYAHACYSGRSVADPDRCNFFAQATIPYKCAAAHCPFSDRHYCWGTYNARNCSTGWVDASYLGINSNKSPKFSRTSICSPLNMDAGFVNAHQNSSTREWFFDYYLGSFNSTFKPTAYTYRQQGSPFSWAIPAYLVNSYQSGYYREIDHWKPLTPQLDRANNTFLTLMFIVSAHILYAAPSTDYIFQTTQKYLDSDYFWNGDPESHPLACVDYIELRASDGTYYPRIDQEHNTEDKEFDYLRAALRRSTTYDSIQSRGGNALVAQGKVRAFFSAELAKHQWEVEAENLFATSLARAQYDAWDIATGLGQDKFLEGSYTNETDQLCNLYKYKLPKAYANFNLVAYAGFALLSATIVVLGYETNAQFHDPEQKKAFRGNKLVGEWLWDRARRLWSRATAMVTTAKSKITAALPHGHAQRVQRSTSGQLPQTSLDRRSPRPSTRQGTPSLSSSNANLGAGESIDDQTGFPDQATEGSLHNIDLRDQNSQGAAGTLNRGSASHSAQTTGHASAGHDDPGKQND